MTTRLSRRPGIKATAFAALLAGTGLAMSGAAPAAGRQVVTRSLSYTCRSAGVASEWQQVPVRVAVSIPSAAAAGQPIQPTGADIAVALSRAQLARLNASNTSLSAQFGVDTTGNGASVADPWLLQAVSAPVSSSSNLILHIPGTVPPITERKPGNITFTATGLSLLLMPHESKDSAANAPAASPAATAGTSAASSAAVRLSCSLNPGESATLATVPIAAPVRHGVVAAASSTFPWEASPGGPFSGRAKSVTFKDTATGTVIACKPSSMSGKLASGRGLPGAGIGSLASVTFQACSGPGGKTFTISTSASASRPWLLNALSYDSTLGTTALTISNITVSISGPGCTATVAGTTATTPGSVAGTSTDAPALGTNQPLRINPASGTLHVWNVNGCGGLLGNGNSLSLAGTYTIVPGQDIVPAYCPPFPVKTGFPFNPRFPFPKPPPGSTITFPQPPQQGCAFIKGFSNVRKLGEAALVGPGFGNIQVGKRIVFNQKFNYFESDSSGKLYFKPCSGNASQCRAINGLPPVHATFLSFGFMPTTATLQITQTGTLNIASVGTLHNGVLKFSRVSSLASIQVKSVLVNGVPLAVGSNCRTVKPFKLVLVGRPPYQLQTGGVLIGMIDVPTFTGCGVGENIDPIFNAAVSGPGNMVKLTQGTLCTDWPVPPLPPGCPATVPKPTH